MTAWASMGSPRVVPVPWASTASMWCGASWASASACWMTRTWAGPLGAVSPLEAPSWLTALPRTTASTLWPLRRASDSRSTRSMPAPSAQAAPAASSEKEWQRPSGDRARRSLNSTNISGLAMRAAPPASAREHSPLRSDWIAEWRATREEEQAVSMVTAGPSSPRV